MANLSSFFPAAAAGGGGFTKSKVYSSIRAATGYADEKIFNAGDSAAAPGFTASGSSTLEISNWSSTFSIYGENASLLNGLGITVYDTVTGITQVFTLGSRTAGATTITNQAITFNVSPNLSSGINGGSGVSFNGTSNRVVNPASDLGLSDGDQIGYFMVGGGGGADIRSSTANFGGRGGRILYGTATITNASTDLTLSIGYGTKANSGADGTESAIAGGLTLTTADGNRTAGWYARQQDSNTIAAGGSGILGYGAGGGAHFGGGADTFHGSGAGARSINSSNVDEGSDGSIILYY